MSLKKTLFISVLPILLATSCTDEYWRFHEEKRSLDIQKQATGQRIQDFRIEQIEDRDIEVLTTPDKKVLDRLLSMIDRSEKQVFVEVYILTEKRIIQALKDAKKR